MAGNSAHVLNIHALEACSTMRALGVLSSAFSLNASARQGACKRLRFKSIGVSPENPRWLPKQLWVFVRDFARNIFRFDFGNDDVCFFVRISEMEQFKLKVGRCFVLISNQLGDLICLLLGAAIFIERELAIVQQCNDHTDKRSLERSHC